VFLILISDLLRGPSPHKKSHVGPYAQSTNQEHGCQAMLEQEMKNLLALDLA